MTSKDAGDSVRNRQSESRPVGRRPSLVSLVAHGVFERVQYPSLAIGLFLFWSALVGAFGTDLFGIPYLFWHAQAEIAVCAGLAVGVVLGEWCFVNFMLDSDREWLRRWVSARGDEQVLTQYLFWTNLAFAAVFLPAPFLHRLGGDLAAFNLIRATMSAMAIVTGVAIYVGCVACASAWVRSDSPGMAAYRGLVEVGLRWVQGVDWFASRAARQRGEVSADQDGEMVWVHAVGGLFFGVWLVVLAIAGVIYARVEEYDRWLDAAFSPAVLICVLAVLAVRIYGFLVFHAHRLYFAGLAAVVVVMGGASHYDWFGHKYPLPGMPFRHTFPSVEDVMTAQLERVERLERGLDEDTDRKALEKWLEQVERSDESPVLVLVATSGGGLRAQVWTTAVFGALERMIPEFPYRTRVVTGASGGMVGAAYYVGTLKSPEHPWAHGQNGTSLSVERLVEVASHDALTPTARTLFFRDLPRQVLPFLGGRDRGEALQATWIRNSGGSESAFRRPLRDLEASELAGWCPSLVFSPALLEDGRRLLLSNLNLAPLTASQLPRSGAQEALGWVSVPSEGGRERPRFAAISAIEGRLIEDRLNYRFDLATAARLNASFPLASPPVAMPIDQLQWSLGDAAYYDNYGMDVAVRWLERHRERLMQWRASGRLKGILIVQIVASEDPRNVPPQGRPTWADGWLTPVGGFFSHGFQKIVQTSDEQLEALAKSFPEDADGGGEFLRLETIAFRGEASLSWYLTPEEVHAIVYPLERIGSQGQLDFDRQGTPAFQRALGRAGTPTEALREFRTEMQRQLADLHQWWHSRQATSSERAGRDPRMTDQPQAIEQR